MENAPSLVLHGCSLHRAIALALFDPQEAAQPVLSV